MTSPLFDEFDVLDTVISSIAILSNPDWTDKRKTPQAALDEIHSLTSAVIGGVMKRIAERTATDRNPHQEDTTHDTD